VLQNSEKCQGISWCLESGHRDNTIITVCYVLTCVKKVVLLRVSLSVSRNNKNMAEFSQNFWKSRAQDGGWQEYFHVV